MTTYAELFSIGLRVTYTGDMCNLPGKGIITTIMPPDQWMRCATVDIILEDGRLIRGYPIDSIRPIEERAGSKHRVLAHPGHYAEEGEIAGFHATYAAREAQERAKETEAKERHARQIVQVKRDHPFLTPMEERYARASKVAKNVRAYLKVSFPGTKFSVTSETYSGGDAINVRWIDGPRDPDVDAVVSMFEHGSFDGMTDCYNYEHSAFTDVFGGVRYVHCSREYSDQVVAQAIAEVCPPGCTVEQYRAGKLMDDYRLAEAVRRWLNDRAF